MALRTRTSAARSVMSLVLSCAGAVHLFFPLLFSALQPAFGYEYASLDSPALTVEHFGVPGLNNDGVVGIIAPQCKKNCNFRGLCSDGVCYCQPGFSGNSCDRETVSKRGNYALNEVGMVSLGVFLVVFMLTFSCLQYQEYSKKATERAMGYAV
ncbi:unnamed protein product [Amoebophrya sp. A120]|nr:unnamed protein product [Amoebophrya sp. A120]|eukprot:GSA120T00002831001.1